MPVAWPPRRGSTAVILAIASVGVCVFGALVLDANRARVAAQETQNVADAAAHAAALWLDGTEAGLATAEEMARVIVAAQGVPVDDASVDVRFGTWSGGAFTESADAAEVVAVRVGVGRPGWQMLLAPTFQARQSLDLAARAVALSRSGDAGGMECYLPLAIADCLLDTYGKDGLQDVTLTLNPAGVDNAGWARLGANPNASWIRDQIRDCEQDGEITVADSVGLNNGVITSALQELADAVSSSTTSWDTARWGAMPSPLERSSVTNYGRTLEGAMVLFDGGPDYCSGSGGSFTGSERVTGFVWGAVYDVVATGPASGKNIRMRLDTSTERDLGTRTGGVEVGIIAWDPPAIVW